MSIWGNCFPFHACRRTDGSPLPTGAVEQDNVLIIPSPVPDDSGEYICISGDANFTYFLSVQNPLTTSPMTSPGPIDAGGLSSMGYAPSGLCDNCCMHATISDILGKIHIYMYTNYS